MDRLAGMDLFIRIVETGSFSKAASELGVAQPTATKAVAAIEARLGARLLHRSTRGVTTTEVGALFYEKCKRISGEIEQTENLASLLQSGASGQLRISTSLAFGRRVMAPLVLRYLRQNPGLTIDISFDDRYVSLVEQGVDLAIRMGRLADSSLGARYLGTNPWLMVASPSYLAAHPAPRQPADLAAHQCLIYSSVQGDDRWNFSAPSGEKASVPVRGPLRANNLSAVLMATLAGFGLAVLPWYVARESLAEGSLVQVLPEHTLQAQDVHAVYPSPKLVPSKVTSFIAFLQQAMAGDWWQHAP
jgi:DNA-binding transcriptional LysR family regulator